MKWFAWWLVYGVFMVLGVWLSHVWLLFMLAWLVPGMMMRLGDLKLIDYKKEYYRGVDY
jgi:hypothetical protein